METGDFIMNALQRLQGAVKTAVKGLSHEELTWRPTAEANSIGFILWHQIRCEDSFIQGMIQQKPQVWIKDKWCQKLGMPENPADVGYGYTVEQVAAFPVPELKDLLEYAEATRAQTVEYLKTMTPEKLDQTSQTPFGELAIGQCLIMMLSDIYQHTGQIAYLRGLQRGLNK